MRFFLMRPLVTWLSIDVSPVSPPQFPSSQIDTKPFCIVIRKYIRRKCEFRRALLLRCGLVYKANHWFWFLIRITEWKSQRVAWNRKYGGIFGTSVELLPTTAEYFDRPFFTDFHSSICRPGFQTRRPTTLTFKSGIYTTACSCKPHLRVKSSRTRIENELEANFCHFTSWQFSIVDLSGKCPSKCASQLLEFSSASYSCSRFYIFVFSCSCCSFTI